MFHDLKTAVPSCTANSKEHAVAKAKPHARHHGCRKAHGNCNKRLISNNARPDMDALKTTRPSLLLKLYALALDIFVCQDRSIS